MRHDDVADDSPDDHRRCETQPGIVVRKVALQALGDPHPCEEVLDDRQASDQLARELELP